MTGREGAAPTGVAPVPVASAEARDVRVGDLIVVNRIGYRVTKYSGQDATTGKLKYRLARVAGSDLPWTVSPSYCLWRAVPPIFATHDLHHVDMPRED